MNDLAIWILDWDEEGIQKMKEQFEAWYPDAGIFTYCNRNADETTNMNHSVKESARMGFAYYHMANADVVYRYQETIPILYKWLVEHSDTALIHPFTQGEDAQPFADPYEFYLQDATGATYRLDMTDTRTGEKWLPLYDEEYLATGWSDLDFGEEIMWRTGLILMNDRRYPVKHIMGNTRRRDQKSYLKAMERRNRLILQAKWHWAGRDNWKGVEAYNTTVQLSKKIPTRFELMNYTDDELQKFWRSVCPEHPRIWQMDGRLDPNDFWDNPIVTGYDSRKKFQDKYGYGG